MSGYWIVQDGDCMSSIAVDTGFAWQTLWNLPENSDLKARRKNPNVLFPGDRVYIPDLRLKNYSAATDNRYKLRRKSIPSRLKIQCLQYGKPLRNKPYRLTLQGDSRDFRGNTDGDGKINIAISPKAEGGTLIVGDSGKEVRYEISLGTMNPIDTISGIKSRLANLGFYRGIIDESEDASFRAAVRGFRAQYQLPAGDKVDDQMKNRLQGLGV